MSTAHPNNRTRHQNSYWSLPTHLTSCCENHKLFIDILLLGAVTLSCVEHSRMTVQRCESRSNHRGRFQVREGISQAQAQPSAMALSSQQAAEDYSVPSNSSGETNAILAQLSETDHVKIHHEREDRYAFQNRHYSDGQSRLKSTPPSYFEGKAADSRTSTNMSALQFMNLAVEQLHKQLSDSRDRMPATGLVEPFSPQGQSTGKPLCSNRCRWLADL